MSGYKLCATSYRGKCTRYIQPMKHINKNMIVQNRKSTKCTLYMCVEYTFTSNTLFFTGKILRRQSGIVIGAGSQLGHFNGYVDNVSTSAIQCKII